VILALDFFTETLLHDGACDSANVRPRCVGRISENESDSWSGIRIKTVTVNTDSGARGARRWERSRAARWQCHGWRVVPAGGGQAMREESHRRSHQHAFPQRGPFFTARLALKHDTQVLFNKKNDTQSAWAVHLRQISAR
jgi:hypothetical protein